MKCARSTFKLLLKTISRRSTYVSHVLEPLEHRRLFTATGIEPVGGVGNNIANPSWGTTGTDLIRLSPVGYANGVSTPSLPNNLSARTISNLVNDQQYASNPTEDLTTVDQDGVSDFGYAFGQFMDHDMDLTPDGGASFPIAVAANDDIGPSSLAFTRSQTDPATGFSTTNPLQDITTVSSYLDLSQVYGSTQIVSDALRTFGGGLLKTSPGNMLPYDNKTYFTQAQINALAMTNDSGAAPQSALFAAGDVRANENIELTALETLFVRNHNSIATQLRVEHSSWTDEQLYQEARKLNIAEYQNIIYTGWIPAVMGKTALPAYAGYNPTINATIANEFSTVAFRFGHSLVSPDIARAGNDGQNLTAAIPLAEDFDDPYLLNPKGAIDPLTGLVSTDIGPILKGDADGDGQNMDVMAVSAIRNVLFGNAGQGGDDLIARDVQRGRDMGIGSYNSVRVAMGLPAVTSFAQITSNVLVQQQLKAAYPGGVGTIDAFEGGMAENHVAGSDVGPLFQAIMVNQFRRLRDGDRYFYLNESFNADELSFFQKGSTLAQVIASNSTAGNLQSDVFYFTASIGGTVAFSNTILPLSFLSPPVSNVTVELEDTYGDILATTKTNILGQYVFTQISGPGTDPTINYGVSGTGYYKVVLALPSGFKQVTANPDTIEVTTGASTLSNINFGVNFTSAIPIVFNPVSPLTSVISNVNQLILQLLG